ncbi:hypothetical protein C7M84_007642 [Penaeus vannamei]|uniref:Uncharacterized protein n=1 Tax=Penaeus vannamei TaxID=6689 RepID=A0A3R7ME26_PENVA|nr:hypothetical protein C7M84_007642 [Penaeus vannamei]
MRILKVKKTRVRIAASHKANVRARRASPLPGLVFARSSSPFSVLLSLSFFFLSPSACLSSFFVSSPFFHLSPQLVSSFFVFFLRPLVSLLSSSPLPSLLLSPSACPFSFFVSSPFPSSFSVRLSLFFLRLLSLPFFFLRPLVSSFFVFSPLPFFFSVRLSLLSSSSLFFPFLFLRPLAPFLLFVSSPFPSFSVRLSLLSSSSLPSPFSFSVRFPSLLFFSPFPSSFSVRFPSSFSSSPFPFLFLRPLFLSLILPLPSLLLSPSASLSSFFVSSLFPSSFSVRLSLFFYSLLSFLFLFLRPLSHSLPSLFLPPFPSSSPLLSLSFPSFPLLSLYLFLLFSYMFLLISSLGLTLFSSFFLFSPSPFPLFSLFPPPVPRSPSPSFYPNLPFPLILSLSFLPPLPPLRFFSSPSSPLLLLLPSSLPLPCGLRLSCIVFFSAFYCLCTACAPSIPALRLHRRRLRERPKALLNPLSY